MFARENSKKAVMLSRVEAWSVQAFARAPFDKLRVTPLSIKFRNRKSDFRNPYSIPPSTGITCPVM